MSLEKTYAYCSNYVPSASSASAANKNILWLLGRVLSGDPSAGLNWKDISGAGVTPSGGWTRLQSCKGSGTTAGTDYGATTTVAAGSNGAALPQATINVASTTGFPASGTFVVMSSAGPQVITYTSTSGGNQFMGCTGGTGNLATSQNVYDNRDFLTSTFTAGNIVQAAAASNHSWEVYFSPANFGGSGQGPFYLVLDFSNATVSKIGNILLSKIAPTGGTGTACPTSTDQVGMHTTGYQFVETNTATAFHVSALLSTDGVVRIWWSVDGDGAFTSVFRMDALTSPLAGDGWPVGFLIFSNTGLPGSTSWIGSHRLHSGNSSNGTPTANNSCWRTRSGDGSTIVNLTMVIPCHNDSATGLGQNPVGQNTGTNQVNGQWDQIPYVGLQALQPGFAGYRGRLPDTYFGSGCRKSAGSNGLTDGVFDNTNHLQVIGDTWEPAIAGQVF